MSIAYSEYRSPLALARIAMAGVCLVGAIDAFAGIIGVFQITDPTHTIDLDEAAPLSLWLMIQSLLALVGFAALIGGAVVFLIWLHRTYTNLPALRSESTEFTPGWAVGWWFIPFANLVKPYQAVRNVWAESDPDTDAEGGGFLSSVQPSGPMYMKTWWAFWLLSNIASNATANVFDPEKMSTVTISGYFFILAGLLRLPAAALAVYVIHDITERQELRYRRVGPLGPPPPPPPPAFQ